MVRFRTNYIIIVTGTDKAECGRSAPRFRVIGRSDDMVVVRGINVFPTMIAEVINQIDSLSGEYRILLDQLPPYDYLPIEVELANEVPDQSDLANHIEHEIKQTVGASAKVTLLAPQSLPRTEGKSKRVIRDF